MDTLGLLYAHREDPLTPVEETMGVFADLVERGHVRELGMSNHRTWRLERARAATENHGWPRPRVLQYRYTYLQARNEVPLLSPGHTFATPELFDHIRAEAAQGREYTLLVYNSLLSGAYTRPDRPFEYAYDHPGTPARLAVLDEVLEGVDLRLSAEQHERLTAAH